MPAIFWDEGTTYDFLASLYVLHYPVHFGMRSSWAAGVRSRLPAGFREILNKTLSFLPVPLSWLYLLPAEAKNVAGALHYLAQINTAERLPSLLITPDTPIEAIHILQGIALRHTWSSAEQEVLRAAFLNGGLPPRPNALRYLCEAWFDLNAFGEQLLQAFNAYYQVFFCEEEARIRPFLSRALEQAQAIASRSTTAQLLETLSRGVHFAPADLRRELVLVPSYWANPLVFYGPVPGSTAAAPARLLVLFGSRPPTQDLAHEETLPDGLVDAMKAIADPTRLRILRFLDEGPQTPSQLARRLRLRAPTVIHHLNILRLTGLVEIRLHSEGERGYELRRQAISGALANLTGFLAPRAR